MYVLKCPSNFGEHELNQITTLLKPKSVAKNGILLYEDAFK
jgi:hypothetical protein